MGVDFIKLCAPSFRKAWNHGKLELATPSLFTRLPGASVRSVVAQCDSLNEISSGAPVTVVAEGNSLLVLHGTRPIGRIDRVPGDELQRINSAGGIALGKIGQIHPLSETIDVELH